jgi:hypothetical protein
MTRLILTNGMMTMVVVEEVPIYPVAEVVSCLFYRCCLAFLKEKEFSAADLRGGRIFSFQKRDMHDSCRSKIISQSGYDFDPAQFNKASVYEGQEDDAGKIHCRNLFPCSGLHRKEATRVNRDPVWHGAAPMVPGTILEASSAGVDPDKIKFSPLFYTTRSGSKVVKALIFSGQWSKCQNREHCH